jgi:hypothetical protein
MKYITLTLSIFYYTFANCQSYQCAINFDKDWKPLAIASSDPNRNGKTYEFRIHNKNEVMYYRNIYLTDKELSNYINFKKTSVSTNKPCVDFFSSNNKCQGFAQRLSFMGLDEKGNDYIVNQGYFVQFKQDGTVNAEYYQRTILDKYYIRSEYITADNQNSYFNVKLYYRANSNENWREVIRVYTGRTIKQYCLFTGNYFMFVYAALDGDGSSGYYSGVSRKIKCGIKGEEQGKQSVIISKEDFYKLFQKENPDISFIPILTPLKFNISESDFGMKSKDIHLDKLLKVLDEVYLTDQECWYPAESNFNRNFKPLTQDRYSPFSD